LTQTFLIGVPVLRDDRADPLGMRQCEPKPDRSSVIEDVDRVSINTDGLCESVDDLGQILKAVAEFFAVGRVGKAEARNGRHQRVAVSQGWNEIAIVGLATRREAKAGYLTSCGSPPDERLGGCHVLNLKHGSATSTQ
jgi:hypothetical protein